MNGAAGDECGASLVHEGTGSPDIHGASSTVWRLEGKPGLDPLWAGELDLKCERQ